MQWCFRLLKSMTKILFKISNKKMEVKILIKLFIFNEQKYILIDHRYIYFLIILTLCNLIIYNLRIKNSYKMLLRYFNIN